MNVEETESAALVRFNATNLIDAAIRGASPHDTLKDTVDRISPWPSNEKLTLTAALFKSFNVNNARE